MATITISVDNGFKNILKAFPWINWSEIAREEALKKLILEKYLTREDISEEEWNFCEQMDWHPVDELPFKKEFIEKVKKAKLEKSVKLKLVEDIFEP